MRPPSPALVITGVVLVAGLLGCSSADRPHAYVATLVEREDRRIEEARLAVRRLELADRAKGALASAGMALAELTSVEVASGGLLWGPLYVSDHKHKPAQRQGPVVEDKVLPPEPPAGWLSFDGSYGVWMRESEDFDVDDSYDEDDPSAASNDGPDGRNRRKGGNRRPKVYVNFMQLKFYGRPVSFSGSLKGGRGVQIKASIKL